MLAKCIPIIMVCFRSQRFLDKKAKLKICSQVHTTAKYVVERTKTGVKCTKIKNARAKRAKLIVNYANLRHSCQRGCLKLPNNLTGVTGLFQH